MRKDILIRIILDLLILVSVVEGFWFVALPLAVIGCWNFSYFIEMLLAGMIYDALFGLIPETSFASYYGSIFSLVIFLIIIQLKKVVRN